MRTSKIYLGCGLALFAISGSILAYIVLAAQSGIGVEAENGTLSQKVTLVTDASASAGKAIRFGSGSSGVLTPLPSKVIAAYWINFAGPPASTVITEAPGYNLFYAAFAWSENASSDGTVRFNPGNVTTPEALKADVATSKARGTKWVLSMGGGGDSTVRLLNESNVTNMFNSLVSIIDYYGFEGLDYDLECGGSCWNADSAVSLAQRLKAKYGNNFIISAAPRPYETRDSSGPYAQFAQKAGDSLDLFGLQFYDFNEANNAGQLASIIRDDVNTVVGLGVPASKIMIGAITYDGYSAGHNSDEIYASIVNAVQAEHPTLRGAYVWNDELDQKNNWGFMNVVGEAVRD